MLGKRDHSPRSAIDWAFDFGQLAPWQTGEGEGLFSWVEWQSPMGPALECRSSGCSVNNNCPVVRLRWTDQELATPAAD
jgi:hypothetical protein